MPGVSREQIDRAKDIDLLAYLLTHEPESIKKSGRGEYTLKEHDSLKISNGKWHWFSRGVGGKSALDFLIHVRGVDFVRAVQQLAGGEAPAKSAQEAKSHPVSRETEKTEFAPPPRNTFGTRAINYLRERGIDEGVIVKCLTDGTVYEGKHKKYPPSCVFVGKDREGKARYAAIRGVGNAFKGEAEGSDKRYGFSIASASELSFSRYLFVTESAIDAMSVASLMRVKRGAAWLDYQYVSLGGTSPLALLQFLKDHKEVKKIYLCLDNDEAGAEGCRRIREAIKSDPELRERVLDIIDRMPEGKDYNDVLMGYRAACADLANSADVTENRRAVGAER
jgi:hypothetical protein